MGRMVCRQRQQIQPRVLIHLELVAVGEEWGQETELDSDKIVQRCSVAGDDFRLRGGEGEHFQRDSELVDVPSAQDYF